MDADELAEQASDAVRRSAEEILERHIIPPEEVDRRTEEWVRSEADDLVGMTFEKDGLLYEVVETDVARVSPSAYSVGLRLKPKGGQIEVKIGLPVEER